jgi:hypothetical protein
VSKDTGHYRCYVPREFRADTLLTIEHANKIIAEYGAKGYALTLRQLYYQFVARGLVENTPQSYDRLGSVINDGRLAGLISWAAIEDRTRALQGLQICPDYQEALRRAEKSFRLDLWKDQPWRPEVWVEKEALVDVVGRICDELRVDYFPCRGYVSQSEQWRAGRRIAGRIHDGQRPIVFHLGDHDPSGIDMTRDNRDRLSMFAGVPVLVQRLALNMPQIEKYNPPPNPAKMTDARYGAYRSEYGEESWELDALDPEVIHDLIRDAVLRVRDEEKWNKALLAEAEDRRALQEIIEEAGGGQKEEKDYDDAD